MNQTYIPKSFRLMFFQKQIVCMVRHYEQIFHYYPSIMLADGDVGSFDAVLLINQAAYFPLSYSIKQPFKNMHTIQKSIFY